VHRSWNSDSREHTLGCAEGGGSEGVNGGEELSSNAEPDLAEILGQSNVVIFCTIASHTYFAKLGCIPGSTFCNLRMAFFFIREHFDLAQNMKRRGEAAVARNFKQCQLSH